MSNFVVISLCALAVLLIVPFILLIFASLGNKHQHKKKPRP